MTQNELSNFTEEQRTEKIAAHLAEIITLLGEDVSRPGLLKTPVRAAKALMYATQGYRQDAQETLRSAMFDHDGSGLVMVRDIEFYSMCEHHILPFFGTISVSYLPQGRIVGLSKLARVVDICARKLQVQERLTAEVARAVAEATEARGVLVVARANHLCMKMRGVEKQDSTTTTIEYNGVFDSDTALRNEALQALLTH
ncbi:MAG: GTP cyclohydrolase I FolE [Muribaculaceae bacterium]|nr:GTP cyclohydrolase I FolE [Muribaculaceae bacterium]